MTKWGGRKAQRLKSAVFDLMGSECWMCGGEATTVDHVVPRSAGGSDELDNLRPACRRCNSRRQDRAVAGAGARVVIVAGAPAAGKSTYVRQRAQPADVVIDLDVIAHAIMPPGVSNDPAPAINAPGGINEPGGSKRAGGTLPHSYPGHIRHVAIGMRQAAIKRATRLAEPCTVWLIHATPSAEQIEQYRSLGWEIIAIDPGRDVVLQRALADRPSAVMASIDRWYSETARLLAGDDESSAIAPPSRQW